MRRGRRAWLPPSLPHRAWLLLGVPPRAAASEPLTGTQGHTHRCRWRPKRTPAQGACPLCPASWVRAGGWHSGYEGRSPSLQPQSLSGEPGRWRGSEGTGFTGAPPLVPSGTIALLPSSPFPVTDGPPRPPVHSFTQQPFREFDCVSVSGRTGRGGGKLEHQGH